MSVVQFDAGNDGRFSQTMARGSKVQRCPACTVGGVFGRRWTGTRREGAASPSFRLRHPPRMDTAGRITRPREFGVEDVRFESVRWKRLPDRSHQGPV